MRRPERRPAQAIASLDDLMHRAAETARTTRMTTDEAAAVIVEDLERAAAALNTRVAPLVPGCGFLVAVAGLLFKAEPSSRGLSELFVGLAVTFAVGGIWLLTNGLFTYAGRRAIGLVPTVEDIAFAHDRLVRKHTSTRRGGWLAGIALTCLMIGILLGVQIDLNVG